MSGYNRYHLKCRVSVENDLSIVTLCFAYLTQYEVILKLSKKRLMGTSVLSIEVWQLKMEANRQCTQNESNKEATDQIIIRRET